MNFAHTAYVGMGSNIGDRITHCKTAVSLLADHPHIIITKQSSWIETSFEGSTEIGTKHGKFINGVLEISTALDPMELLETLLLMETTIGRVRRQKWEPRIIDLDLLLYDDLSMNTEKLILPHPFMKFRDFVKIPLLEINPNLKHYFK